MVPIRLHMITRTSPPRCELTGQEALDLARGLDATLGTAREPPS
jgi:hypothetical protein